MRESWINKNLIFPIPSVPDPLVRGPSRNKKNN